MAQWVRFVSKPGEPYSSLEISLVEGKNRSLQVVLCGSSVPHGMHTSPSTDKTNKERTQFLKKFK